MRRTLCAWRSPALTGRDVNPPGGGRPRSVSCLSRRRVVASRRQDSESISGSLCQISESSVSKVRLLSESSWRRVVAALRSRYPSQCPGQYRTSRRVAAP